MLIEKENLLRLTLFGLSLLFSLCMKAQELTTYTVDPTFSTGNLFRDPRPVYDILQQNNGKLLIGGSFEPSSVFNSPFRGIGRVHSNGNEDFAWGGQKPIPLAIYIIMKTDIFLQLLVV